MDTKINAVKFRADQKLIDFIEGKVEKLSQYFDRIISSEVTLKVDADEKPDNKITEIKIVISGDNLFAKKQADSFEEATDLAVEALRRQLKKHKEKLREK